MIRIFLILFCVAFAFSELTAQKKLTAREQEKADSLREKFVADSSYIWRYTVAKPFLKVENRYSFVSNEEINLLGFMAGGTFFNTHTFFAGYFFLDPRSRTSPIQFANRSKDIQHFLNMQYFVLGYQYVIISKRYFQINFPFAVGLGNYRVEVTDEQNNVLSTNSGRIWPTNTGLQFIFKPIKWAGLSASGGYRFIGRQENTELVLKGWYYSFGLWVDGRHLYRSLRYANKKRLYRKALETL